MREQKGIVAGRSTVDPERINEIELGRSERDLEAWHVVANPPNKITPMLRVDMQSMPFGSPGRRSDRTARPSVHATGPAPL